MSPMNPLNTTHLSASDRKERLVEAMTATRQKTLELFARIPDELLNLRVHDFYSPIGWHFGHIGMTEEYWALVRALGQSARNEAYNFLFANIPDNPKDNRVNLPSREEILAYLACTRDAAINGLLQLDLNAPETLSSPLLTGAYAWDFALQHECQHQETICELLQLLAKYTNRRAVSLEAVAPQRLEPQSPGQMVMVNGGTFPMGCDDPTGYDNEKCAHTVTVDTFQMDSCPVNTAQWIAFIEDGGYRRRELWSAAGWAWRQAEGAEMPEYWCPIENTFGYYGVEGLRTLYPQEPVSSVSWYEADAYARWAGKRLPTEAEWEFAARYVPHTNQICTYPWGDTSPSQEVACYGMATFGRPTIHSTLVESGLGTVDRPSGMAGGVWEWTSTPFLPYPGFQAYPYDGYSKDHMDGNHYCCRGGSWVTDARILRACFRNWYVPTYRQGFLGVRCAC